MLSFRLKVDDRSDDQYYVFIEELQKGENNSYM